MWYESRVYCVTALDFNIFYWICKWKHIAPSIHDPDWISRRIKGDAVWYPNVHYTHSCKPQRGQGTKYILTSSVAHLLLLSVEYDRHQKSWIILWDSIGYLLQQLLGMFSSFPVEQGVSWTSSRMPVCLLLVHEQQTTHGPFLRATNNVRKLLLSVSYRVLTIF